MAYVSRAVGNANAAEQLDVMQAIVSHRSLRDMQPILRAIDSKHKQAMPLFMEDHDDAMEALVLGDQGRAVQRVMEGNAAFFADLFCRVPSLLNNAFEVCLMFLICIYCYFRHHLKVSCWATSWNITKPPSRTFYPISKTCCSTYSSMRSKTTTLYVLFMFLDILCYLFIRLLART